jgi:carboxyl-terminal processing protease
MKALVLAVGLIMVACSAGGEPLSSTDEKALDGFADAVAKMKSNYVQPIEIQSLIDSAIAGAVGSLDPHSSHLTKEEFDDLAGRPASSMGGVGFELTQRNGVPTIISPIDGGPAARAGLKSGDVIMEIDGAPVYGRSLISITHSLRGPVGSNVTIKIARRGASLPTELTLALTRASVRTAVTYRKEGACGYIRIARSCEEPVP